MGLGLRYATVWDFPLGCLVGWSILLASFQTILGGGLHRGGYPLINQGSDLHSGLRGVWPTPRGLEEGVITLEGRAEGSWGRENGRAGASRRGARAKIIVRK